jgi:hypothetical protein
LTNVLFGLINDAISLIKIYDSAESVVF